MGKAKKRSLKNGISDQFPYITRENALEYVIENISNKSKIMDTITLFGLSAEEMLENGASYEDVIALGPLIK